MYVQRTQALNIQLEDEQAASGTNWNNVQSRLRDLFRPNPGVGQQRKNILQTLVGQFAALPSDEDSFAGQSQILSSTPVISKPKNGSLLSTDMKLPRISAIPRTPLRSVSSLANVSTRQENASIKRKSTGTPMESAKKIKTDKSIETVHKTPKSALHFIEQFNNMESPYNSPLTPNTIRNLNHQQSLYRTYQQSRISNFKKESVNKQTSPLTTKIDRVCENSDSSSEENFLHQSHTPQPEDFFGIYKNAEDDDDELQQESTMPPSSYKCSLSRHSSLKGSSSGLNSKAKSRKSVIADSSDEEEEDDDHHNHHNSGFQSPVYSSPVEDAVEEDDHHHHHHHHLMSPASASSHSDSCSDEEEEEEEKPLPRGNSSSRPKHSKDSLKRRIAKHLDEHSAVIRPSDTTFDCRRSKRNRVRPVNYWAGERPLYQKSITKDGNCVSTLVGVSSVRRIEPTRIGKKRTASAGKGKEAEVSAQKMENILNLSIHKKKLQNNEPRFDPEHVRAFAELDFTESKNSQGVFTVMTKREDKIALGKLKFNPRAKKVPTKTGNYVTHFNVVYGTLLLKVNNDKVGSIIKSGFYVNVDSQTTYSIENLRNDQAVLDFTIIQKP